MLRPTSFSGTDAQPLPQTPKARRRPVSEVHVRPISDLLDPPRNSIRTPTAPVVRFREPEVLDTPKTSTTIEDEPSCYDSDASQTSSAVRRRRRRSSTPRKSTTYLLAKPAPKLGSKKQLLKHVRPRLLLQLQELPADQRRPRPTIDVFPASLIAGPLVTARYIHRFPRIFGVKGELGPRDLILVKSEDYDTYLSESEEDDENGGGRREPVAVLSPVRGLDCDEIVLDDGTVWTARPNQKGGFDFVHVDEHGIMLTARWVKRSTTKAPPTTTRPRPMSPTPSSTSIPTISSCPADASDYKYTFSIIDPLSRRHPILGALTPQSLEVFNDYTTVSSSQGRYPRSRPMSYNLDSASKSTRSPPGSPPIAAADKEPTSERQTHFVDEATKKLIVVTGLWLGLRLSGRTCTSTCTSTCATTTTSTAAAPAPDSAAEATGMGGNSEAQCPWESPRSSMALCVDAVRIPRRQTTSNARRSTPSLPAQQQPSPRGLRRAMSTGAAFMQRRMRQSHPHASDEAGSGSSGFISHLHHHIHNHNNNHHNNNNNTTMVTPAVVVESDELSLSGVDGDSGIGIGSADNKENGDVQHQKDMALGSMPAPAPQEEQQQKRCRRVSWLKKLKH